jgi:hypothetical protein
MYFCEWDQTLDAQKVEARRKRASLCYAVGGLKRRTVHDSVHFEFKLNISIHHLDYANKFRVNMHGAHHVEQIIPLYPWIGVVLVSKDQDAGYSCCIAIVDDVLDHASVIADQVVGFECFLRMVGERWQVRSNCYDHCFRHDTVDNTIHGDRPVFANIPTASFVFENETDYRGTHYVEHLPLVLIAYGAATEGSGDKTSKSAGWAIAKLIASPPHPNYFKEFRRPAVLTRLCAIGQFIYGLLNALFWEDKGKAKLIPLIILKHTAICD